MANLIGNLPNQVPTNGDLGTMAFQDELSVKILGGQVNAAIGGTTPNTIIATMTATATAAPTIASATTIAPITPIVFVSGVTAIATITPPSPISLSGGQITIIPTGIFLTTTAGNIALASTTIVSKALIMTYDVTTAKWYPSY